MIPEKSKHISLLKELNNTMLAAAEQGEWTQLTEMEIKRRELFNELMENVDAYEEGVIAECIEEALANNKVIKKIASEERHQVLGAINELKNRKNVSQAYEQNTSK